MKGCAWGGLEGVDCAVESDVVEPLFTPTPELLLGSRHSVVSLFSVFISGEQPEVVEE